MSAVSAVQATFLGGVVGVSFSRFWFNELQDATQRQAAVDSVRSLLFPLGASYMKIGWSIQVEQKIQNFTLETGKLEGEVLAGTKPPVVAGGVAAATGFQAGVGARILWSTGLVLDGRKVVARTFLVPLANFSGQDGLVLAALKTAMGGACATYVGQPAARPVSWHKKYDRSDTSKPPVYVGGTAVPLTSGAVPDQVSSLRSRRY